MLRTMTGTCDIETIKAHNGHVFGMHAVVIAPLRVLAICQRSFVAVTHNVIQQNFTSSLAETPVKQHQTESPESQNVKPHTLSVKKIKKNKNKSPLLTCQNDFLH